MSSKVELSTTSFTNKDFNTAYPELLGLAKDMSAKWDPTVSNESDPGVVLIKEQAIMLDKINYASDKNALETMPLSVTQQRTARQLFQILGYYPAYIRSAEVKLAIGLNLSSSETVIKTQRGQDFKYNAGNTATLPAFTMVADQENQYIYTIPQKVTLKDNNQVETVVAYQGSIQNVTINNDPIITVDALDQNNRIYFKDTNVAENGIFIFNVFGSGDGYDVSESSLWTRVDNLATQELNNKYFEFGVDISTGSCYVEFPADAADVIGQGVYIKYLLSAGADGNVPINTLVKLQASAVTAQTQTASEDTVDISTDNLYISNIDLVSYGKNAETITESYNNYQRTKGTFDTLVTLRDYNNALYLTGRVSNGFVCDRTNDVQQSYKILHKTLSDDIQYLDRQHAQQYITTNVDSNDYKELHHGEYMQPFDLKIYALQYNDILDGGSEYINRINYNNSFDIYTDTEIENPAKIESQLLVLAELLNKQKCVCHNFKNIEKNKPCLFKNIAEITFTVFPTIQLTSLQQKNLRDDLLNTIYKNYNAHNLTFGEDIDYNRLKSDLQSGSDLVKNIALNPIQYFTYAVYYSENEIYTDITNTQRFNTNTEGALPENFKSWNNGWRTVCVSDETDYIKAEYIENGDQGDFYLKTIDNSDIPLSELYKNKSTQFILQNNTYLPAGGKTPVFTLTSDGTILPYSLKRDDFRADILAKCVLAGRSPLYKYDATNFKYQQYEENTEYICKSLELDSFMQFNFNGTDTAQYRLNDGEVVHFVKPQMQDAITYGSYVKYDYCGQQIPENGSHKLKSGERLIIYYKTTDDTAAPYVKVEYSGDSKKPYVISPNFVLKQTFSAQSGLQSTLANQTPSSALTASASQQIKIQEKNEVILNNTYNYVYVVGNIDRDNDVYSLTLTKEASVGVSGARYSHTLGASEYFIYTNEQKNVLHILGLGAKITIQTNNPAITQKDTFVIKNSVVELSKINSLGLYALQNKWNELKDVEITVLAQDSFNVVDSGSYISLHTKDRPLPQNISIQLKKDGFNYLENGAAPIDPVEICVASGMVKSADSLISTVTTDDLSENFKDFLHNAYGAPKLTTINNDILFTAQAYPQETIEYYERGVKQTLRNTRTAKSTSGTDTKFTVLNGNSSFTPIDISTTGGTPRTTVGTTVINTLQNATPATIEQSDVTGYWFARVSNSVVTTAEEAARYTLIRINDTDYPIERDPDQDDESTGFAYQFYAPTESSIEGDTFNIYINWQLTDIQFGYDPDSTGAIQYTDFNNDAIVIPDTVDQHRLVKLTWSDASTSSEGIVVQPLLNGNDYSEAVTFGASADYAQIERFWGFKDAQGIDQVVSEAELKTDVFKAESYERWFNLPYDWETGTTIQISVLYDYSADGKVNPEIFTLEYKNAGDEDATTILFDNDPDLQYTIGAYITTSISSTEPLVLADNWSVKLRLADSQEVVTIKNDQGINKIYSSNDILLEDFNEISLAYEDADRNICYPTLLVTNDRSVLAPKTTTITDIITAAASLSEEQKTEIVAYINNLNIIESQVSTFEELLNYTQALATYKLIEFDYGAIVPDQSMTLAAYKNRLTKVPVIPGRGDGVTSKFYAITELEASDEIKCTASIDFYKDLNSKIITIGETPIIEEAFLKNEDGSIDFSRVQLSSLPKVGQVLKHIVQTIEGLKQFGDVIKIDEQFLQTHFEQDSQTAKYIYNIGYEIPNLRHVVVETTSFEFEVQIPYKNRVYAFMLKNNQNLAHLSLSKVSSADSLTSLNVEADADTPDTYKLSERNIYCFIYQPDKYSTDATPAPLKLRLEIEALSGLEESWQANPYQVSVYPLQLVDDTKSAALSNSLGVQVESGALPLVVQKINQLDINKEFFYLYQPADQEQILEPLSAYSFNNYNHPFNKFTIPQIRTFNILNESNIIINN